jgi:hypothetical protein
VVDSEGTGVPPVRCGHREGGRVERRGTRILRCHRRHGTLGATVGYRNPGVGAVAGVAVVVPTVTCSACDDLVVRAGDGRSDLVGVGQAVGARSARGHIRGEDVRIGRVPKSVDTGARLLGGTGSDGEVPGLERVPHVVRDSEGTGLPGELEDLRPDVIGYLRPPDRLFAVAGQYADAEIPNRERAWVIVVVRSPS